MLRFEWNALRAEDAVLVHDQAGTDLPLVPGVVVTVDTRRAVNSVGIRIAAADGEARTVWPSHHAVHADPCEPTERCWRCREPVQAARGVGPQA